MRPRDPGCAATAIATRAFIRETNTMTAQCEHGEDRNSVASYVSEDIKSRRERYIRVDAINTMTSQVLSNIYVAISIKKLTILALRIVETRTHLGEPI